MNNKKNLAPVIKITEDKCINCHACINACPVKYCIDGSGDKISINHDLCIGCGNCITSCSHDARKLIDDTDLFFNDLRHCEKIIVVAALASASVFSENHLKLNGYLKSQGVEAIFDAGFGAELAVMSYLDHIKTKKPRMVIAQPCPAIVSFIEIYKPDLISCLAPSGSPILHSIRMIRKFYPKYSNYKIAVISPCMAKRREFDETRLGDYNVTMLSLKNLFTEQNINIESYPSLEYSGPSSESAVLFPNPGGLQETAERFLPGIGRDTRKISGVHSIYRYLTQVSENLGRDDIEFPLLIDCLNCENGCNGSPGTGNNKKSLDEIETPVRKCLKEHEKKLNPKLKDKLYKEFNNLVGHYWKPDLYNREYIDRSENFNIKFLNETELKETYSRMKKFSQDDIYNCTACGYGSCKAMATAIFNNLNKPNNCAHYNLSFLEEEKKIIMLISQQLKIHIGCTLEMSEHLNRLVKDTYTGINILAESVNVSSNTAEKTLDSIKNILSVSQTLSDIITGINSTLNRTGETGNFFREIIADINTLTSTKNGLLNALNILSVESTGITNSLQSLKQQSLSVKNDYSEMISLTDKLRYNINFLAAISTDIVRIIEENDKNLMPRLSDMENILNWQLQNPDDMRGI